MSEITKLLAAAALLAAGFFGASWFGAPSAPQTAGGGWAPEPLQPVDASAVEPQAAAPRGTWDAQVAQAGAFEQSQPERYEAARLNWPATSPGDDRAPEIRSGRDSLAGMSAPGEDDRFASLAAPPLLEFSQSARPLRTSSFPTQPAAPPSEAATAPSLDTQRSFLTFNDHSSGFNQPAFNSSSPPDAWQAPALGGADRLSAPVGEAVWHVVADGDSLPRIAERYLGDASRAREIYELNRDSLMNPDLLPIGEKLRIPQRASEPQPFSVPVNVFDASGSASASYTPQRQLVPLPELPDSVRNAPRARLQRPMSANLAGTGG